MKYSLLRKTKTVSGMVTLILCYLPARLLLAMLAGGLLPIVINAQSREAEPVAIQTGSGLLRGNGCNFIPNKGQVVDSKGNLRPDVLYQGLAKGMDIYLRRTGISYVITKNVALDSLRKLEAIADSLMGNSLVGSGSSEASKEVEKIFREMTTVYDRIPIFFQRIDMDFVGSHAPAVVLEEERAEGYNNYYFGHCPQGITGVKGFNKIIYREIYQGIDVSFRGNKAEGMEYDFIVKPGGNPDDVQIRYNGAEDITLESNKSIRMKSISGEMMDWMPSVYQIINGEKKEITCAYELNNITSNGRETGKLVTFKVGNYDKNQPLIIDPWTTWITYYGGSGLDQCRGITTDADCNVLATGVTGSPNFPVTAGFSMTNTGTGGGFAVKFDAAGNRLWATYVGVSACEDIATDGSGNVFVAGQITSPSFPNFPILSGFQMTGASWEDGFLFKLDGTGNLIWSTYFGGSSLDLCNGVATDGSGNVFVGGYTESTNFPVLSGFQMTYGGGKSDGFIAKFDGTGNLLWSTYMGGAGAATVWESIGGVATDGSGNVFVGGYSASANFPVLGGYQMTNAGGTDQVLAKFDGTGNLLWSTYFGGSSIDDNSAYPYNGSSDVDTDGAGNVFISGITSSANFPVLAGNQMTFSGVSDATLAKFDGAGNLLWATYYGGSDWEESASVAVDKNTGNSYITGDIFWFNTNIKPPIPIKANACQNVYKGGSEENYLAAFNAAGNFLCGTYLGGYGLEEQDVLGHIAVCGCYVYIGAGTENFPVTPSGFQTIIGGSWDAYIAQLPMDCSCSSTSSNISASTTQSNPSCSAPCTGTAAVNVSPPSGSYTYAWNPGGQTTSAVTGLCAGTYFVTVLDGCGSVTKTVVITQQSQITPAVFADPSGTVCVGAQVFASASGGSAYSWNTGATTANIMVTPSITTTYSVIVTDASGCTGIATLTVPVDTGCTATGISQLNADAPHVSIMPNPSNGGFQVSGINCQISGIKIYNVMGAKVYEAHSPKGEDKGNSSLQGGGQTINLSSQPNGIYLLRISVSSGQAKTETIYSEIVIQK